MRPTRRGGPESGRLGAFNPKATSACQSVSPIANNRLLLVCLHKHQNLEGRPLLEQVLHRTFIASLTHMARRHCEATSTSSPPPHPRKPHQRHQSTLVTSPPRQRAGEGPAQPATVARRRSRGRSQAFRADALCASLFSRGQKRAFEDSQEDFARVSKRRVDCGVGA